MTLRSLLTLCAFGAGIAIHAGEIQVNPAEKLNCTGKSDLRQLQKLALAVGWEFAPNAETTAELKRIGIQKIRCINVDALPGHFDDKGNYVVTGENNRLNAHLRTAAELNAEPHIIVGQRLPDQLRKTVQADSPEGRVLGLKRNSTFGPTDFTLYRNFYIAYFEHILLKKGARNAVFEVMNEPDIGGVICPEYPAPARGSAALYDIMYRIYREIAAAAQAVEARNPGVKVRIGGPALAWAYTFRFGSFNWGERFVADCAKDRLKLDFVGVHYYGNISSLHGEYAADYPSFEAMLKNLKDARDKHLPGLPIQINEWGPSYHVNSGEPAMVNANHIGVAWDMEFLKTMLENGVDSAAYLVTTDLMANRNGKPENVWGWCSLFVNPQAFGGKAYPKAAFHLFDLISRLRGERVESTRSGAVNTFAVADAGARKLQILAWNYLARLPEGDVAVDFSIRENMAFQVRDAKRFFGTDRVRVTRRLIGEHSANAYGAFRRGEPLSAANTGLKINDESTVEMQNGALSFGFPLPGSSVSLIEVEPIQQ